MNHWLQQQLAHLDALTVGWLMVLEALVPPLPAEAIMPAAGVAAGQGRLPLWQVILAGTLGSLAGNLVLYGAARWVGHRRVQRFVERRGHWLGITPRDLQRAMGWFAGRGRLAVLFGRLIPGVRIFISLPAGFGEMPVRTFLRWSAAGILLFVSGLALLGDRMGARSREISRWIGPATWAILGAFLLGWVVLVVRRRMEKRRRR